MLVFSSDMSVPKDVSAVGLYIRTRTGTVLYNNVVDTTEDAEGNRSVRFPSTFAILSNGSPATVRVQLIAYGKATPATTGGFTRKAVVMRESTTGVPTDRLSMLRMPLLWINQGSITGSVPVVTTSEGASGLRPLGDSVRITAAGADEAKYRPEEGIKSPCTEDQAWIGGKCRAVDPNAPLPAFTEADAPGSGAAACFNVESCFAAPKSLLGKIQPDGSVDLGGTQATLVNLALITKDEVGLKLPDGRYAISLDSDSEYEGFTIKNDRIVLSEAVREALKSGRAIDLVGTTLCAAKTPDVGNCGPWNPAPNTVKPTRPETIDSDAGPLADGGDAGDATKDAPFDASGDAPPLPPPPQGEIQSGGEPKLQGLAFESTKMFSIRDGMLPQFDTSIRFFQKGIVAQPLGLRATPDMATGATFRVTYLSFGASGIGPWQNKNFVAIYGNGPSAGEGHIYVYDTAQNTIATLPVPVGFQPIGVIATSNFPVFIGPSGVTAAAVGYSDFLTYSPAISFTPQLNAGETPTALVQAVAGANFRIGTSMKNVRTCLINGTFTSIDCTLSVAALPETPVDLAEDTDIFALVARATGSQNNAEGVYEIQGTTPVARLTRQMEPTLHFYPAGTGAAAGTGPRNRLTLAPGKAYGFVTTQQQGTPSQVFQFNRTGAMPAQVVAKNLVDARDILADQTHVYYVDYGTGLQSDGAIFRQAHK